MSADSDLPPPPAARRLTLVGSAVDDLRRAAADGARQLVAWELKLPEGASKARQFVHGLWLPVVVARAVLADARVRGRWLRYSLGQAAATVLVAVLALATGIGQGDDKKVDAAAAGQAVAVLVDRVDARAQELERRTPSDHALIDAERALISVRLSDLEEKLQSHRRHPAPLPGELPILVSRALDDAALERAASRHAAITDGAENVDRQKLKEALEHEVLEGLGRLAGGGTEAERTGETPSSDLAEARSLDPRRMEQEIRRKAKAGEKAAAAAAPEEEQVAAKVAHLLESARKDGLPPPSPEQVARTRQVRSELKAAAVAAVPAAEAELESARPWAKRVTALGISWRLLGWLVALWGVLYGAQFVVVALCRDYHSELSREACLLTGIAPEDPPCDPRPRFDLRWAYVRARRSFRGWWVISLGAPACWLVGLPFPGDGVRNLVFAAWILYWQVVFAASKSARAWVDEFVAPAPWFLRGWRWLVEKVWPLWLLGAGLYLRLWERSTKSLYAPAECVEQLPAPFIGLTIFRLMGSVPLVKIFVGPLVPVASALLLEAHRLHHPARTAPAVLQAGPVLAPAPARTA